MRDADLSASAQAMCENVLPPYMIDSQLDQPNRVNLIVVDVREMQKTSARTSALSVRVQPGPFTPVFARQVSQGNLTNKPTRGSNLNSRKFVVYLSLRCSPLRSPRCAVSSWEERTTQADPSLSPCLLSWTRSPP